MTTRTRGLTLAAVTACISGVSIWVNSHGVAAYGDATAYTTAKNVASALVIAAVWMIARRLTVEHARGVGPTAFTRPSTARHRWAYAYIAILGGAVPFVLFFQGLASTASTQASFLHKTLVVWVALLAVPLLKERLTVWHGAAIALLVLGQLGLAGGVSLRLDIGTLLILAATLMWAVEVIVAKRLLTGVTPWTVSMVRMVGGSVALLTWALLTGALPAVVPRTGDQWLWVAVTGVLLAAYVLTWHQALWRAPAIDVTAVLVLGALVTAALSGAFNAAPLAAQAPWLALIALGGGLVWMAPRPAATRRPVAT
ncbi:DMT family transporter [Demequina capsici]|uniref:DMT family transporter n=1 Tax=Demequina capsici TaxID=3075620 RepID=A0AA96F8Z2_9MICO|nr:DMT family transporter [Demequina sp. PMTSA13]WNM26376.1 DMT family transporter [Demequina sp. PMTSA13]